MFFLGNEYKNYTFFVMFVILKGLLSNFVKEENNKTHVVLRWVALTRIYRTTGKKKTKWKRFSTGEELL